jgi:hypothetical protein
MHNLLTESTGMSVLFSVAQQELKKESNKKRVWSDVYESWGFFSKDITMFDEFLLWCSINPGDRITLDDPQVSIKNIYTVVGIQRDDEVKESPIWIFKLLGSNCDLLDIKVKEKELFLEARKYI